MDKDLKAHCVIALVYCSLAPLAFAEADETRLSISGVTEVVKSDDVGGEGVNFAFGGGLSFGFGFSNSFELGAEVKYLNKPSAVWSEASGMGLSGSGLTAYGDYQAVQAAGTLRFVIDNATFIRLHPVFEFRGGMQWTKVGNIEVFSDATGFVSRLPNQTNWEPFGGMRVGLVWRWTDKLMVGGLVGATYAPSRLQTDAMVEFSWQLELL